jgi:hypothetical protein
MSKGRPTPAPLQGGESRRKKYALMFKFCFKFNFKNGKDLNLYLYPCFSIEAVSKPKLCHAEFISASLFLSVNATLDSEINSE